MKHNRLRTLLVFLALLLACTAAFGEHPNIRKGFQVDSLYSSADVDSVNMFNGNLTVRVPIGPRWTVSNHLSYQFGLTYNSKLWEYQGIPGGVNGPHIMQVKPTHRSNSGMGWLFSFGRILYDNHPSNSSGVVTYESPDGGEHVFYCTMHEDEFPDPSCVVGENPHITIGYSRDGTYLRFRQTGGGAEVDFPDGSTHTFEYDDANFQMRIKQMRDGFGNTVTFEYPTPLSWKITDSGGRTHYAIFEESPNNTNATQFNYRTRLKTLELAQFGTATRVKYEFEYENARQTQRGCIPSNFIYETLRDGEPRIPWLSKIKLPNAGNNENLTWEFDYNATESRCDSGGMKLLKLPTGARIDYTYQEYKLPADGCTVASSLNRTGGIHTRVITDLARGGNPYRWTYTTLLANRDGSWACNNAFVEPYQEVHNTVEQPTGERITHYFSVWPKELDSTDGYKREEYGLPFIRTQSSGGRFLSTQTQFQGSTLKTYVNYEMDAKSVDDHERPKLRDANRRMVASRTVYEDGKFADVQYEDFDALGHYRTARTSGNFEGENDRTVFTNYNPGKKLNTGMPPANPGWWDPTIPHNQPHWVLETYTERKITEDNQPTLLTEFCFDASTGFLNAQRTRKSATTASANDLLAVFGHSRGNLTSEQYYGGDKKTTSASGCTPSGDVQYSLSHTYHSTGTLEKSGYVGAGFFTVNNKEIDSFTGLVKKSTDTSEQIDTTYTYDALGRVKTITPEQGHGPKFEYTYGFTNNAPTVSVKVTANAAGNTTTEIDRKFVRFDGLGRPWREFKRIPDVGTNSSKPWSVRMFEYDAQHRQTRVSQPEEMRLFSTDPTSFDTPKAPDVTTTTYDYLGRTLTLRMPDDKLIAFDYNGVTEAVEKVFRVGHNGSERETRTRRFYDRFGRLAKVEENSRSTRATDLDGGSAVDTTYKYDSADRMTEVKIAGEQTQTRKFTYDPRGFLDKEEHPETGVTDYNDHDARGHALERIFGGKTLTFEYDAAERLKKVTDDKGVLKEFTYASANASTTNLTKGKLQKALRRNDLPTAGRVDVTETYSYAGAAGQMSNRETLVERVTGTSTRTTMQKFNYGVPSYDHFLLPGAVTMPTCSEAGCTSQTTSKGLPSVGFTREFGLLTSVDNFADLTYHPTGMVETVKHETAGAPVDTYAQRDGIPRPSKITFAACGQTRPTWLPDPMRVRPRAYDGPTCDIGFEITWAPAVVCGSSANVKYRLERNGQTISDAFCLTEPRYFDTKVDPNVEYTYRVVAEGPEMEGGNGNCNHGFTSQTAQIFEKAKFTSCSAQTIISANPVTLSIGVPAHFTANLSSANGFIANEPIEFKFNGEIIGTALTGVTGFAQLTTAVDVPPGVYPDSIVVTNRGNLLAQVSAKATLTAVCDVKSYAVKPIMLNVTPGGSKLVPFQVAVAASDRCAWNPVVVAHSPVFTSVTDIRKDKGTFGVAVAENTTSEDRQAKIDVALHQVTVRQSGTGCTFSFDPDVAYLPAETGFGTGVIQVIAAPECSSTVTTSDSSIMSIVEPTADKFPKAGSYQVHYHINDNQTEDKRVAYLILKQGNVEKARAAVNQRAQPKAECPIVILDNLRDGAVEAPGQNISVRIHTTGTQLRYIWYVDNFPMPECRGSSCADFLIDSDSGRFPRPGESVSIQVKVYNTCDLDGVASERVFWRNNSSPNTTCRVPVIQSTLMRENEAPGEIFSPRPGATVGFFVIGLNLSGPHTDLKYQWYHGMPGDRSSKVSNGTGDSIIVNPFSTSFYWLELSNTCGSQISRSGAVFVTAPPGGRRRACCRFDMNADGHSDVPWRNTLTGQNELWLMNLTNRTSTVSLPSISSTTTQLQSIGDLDADEKPDILFRNTATGENQVWLMNNTTRRGAINLESRPGSEWSIGAVADYDDDGHDDIVWHNNANGQNELWFNESTEHAGTWALPKSGNSGLYGAGDFNGDELPDLFFHDRATGQNAIWMMNDDGTRRTVALKESGSPAKRTVTTKIVATNTMADPGFVPALVADMNRDGKPDIFWRNPDTGEHKVWLMNGTTMTSTVAVEPRNEPGWEIGGGGSNNAGPQTPGSGGPVGSGPTTLSIAAESANVGKAAVVTATLLANGQPVPQGAVVFSRSGVDVSTLLTGTDGTATAVVDVEGLAAGTYPGVLGARFEGNASFGPSSATADLVVTAPAATVSWLNPADIVYGTPLSEAQLNATSPVAGIFVYTPAAGTVLEAGYRTLRVTFTPSDPNVAPITRTSVIFVHKAPSSVTWNPPAPMAYGAPLSELQLNATSTLSGFYTYTPGPGTMLPAGTNTLTVLFEPDSPNHESSTGSTTVVVEKGTQRIIWSDPEPITVLTPLGAQQLNARVHPSGNAPAGAVTYDPPLGTVLPQGVHELRVSVAATESYDAASATVDIEVLNVTPTVTWNAPAPIVYGTPLSAAQLNATADVAGTFEYDPPAGTYLEAGTALLRVVFTPADSRYDSVSMSHPISIARGQQTLAWSKPAPIVYGTALSATQLNATVSVSGPSPAASLVYDPMIDTVLPAGAQLLRVTAPETDNYEGATMTVVLDVLKATPVVTWSAPAPIVYRTPLSATQLNATASVPGSFAYTPSAGTVLQAGNGQTLSVRFTPTDTSNYNSVDASTTIDVLRADPILTWATPASIVYRTPLSATQLNATADVPGTFVYTPPAGTVLQAGAGQTLSVQFTPSDTRNFNNASKTTTIEVVKANPILTWPTPATIVYRTALGPTQLNATADVPGTFVYTPPAGTVLQAGAGQTLAVHFTPSDMRNFNDADASTTIEVIKATPILTWQAPAGIVYGTPLSATQLSATADVPGTFDYTPPAGTILDAGTGHTLALHFTPEDTHNFNTVDTTRTIDVAKAKQTLSWTPPAPIVYGTPLSVAQLNASVQVVGPSPAGALTYTPAAGIVLDAGLGQTLTVNAAETKNYEPATLSVPLDVLRKALSLTVDPKSKLYGGIVPPLTGTLLGVVNNDPITPSYSTTGTVQSPAGVYPINGALVDPNHRLFNYDVTITPSTLTVLPAPLTIAADPKSKQYSDPLPLLTPTYTGFVLGETPAVLSGTLVIQTTAAVLSAPGPYAITIGGLSSPNYAITYVGSTLTVLPEDARVINTSPLALSTAASGATTVTLTATVQDISATADAAGDTFPGDIRNATLTFVDRATNATLCVAPIGLVSSSDQRTGIATCNFTRAFGTTLPATLVIGSKIGSHYIRDAAADDVTLTVSAQSPDRVVGGGVTAFATAAGTHAPDLDEAAQFEYQFSYDNNDAVSTNLRLSYQRTEGGVKHSYLLTVDSATSLSTARTTNGGTAIVVGKGTLVDSTDKETIVTGVPMILTLTDVGNGSKTEVDAFGVTLLKPEGGVVFAAGWSGVRTTEQTIRSGQVSVNFSGK